MKKIILFTSLLILLFSVVALAEDDTSSSPAGVFPVGLYDDVVFDKLASGDVRAVTYDTTDIYNLLASALNGSNYLSAYSLPQIASQIRRISTILYGSGQNVPSSGNLYDNLTSYLTAYDAGNRVGLGSMAIEMMYDLIDIKNYNAGLSTSLSGVSSSVSGISSSLSQVVNSVGVLNSAWTPFSVTYNGWSSSLNGSFDTSTNPPNAYDVSYYFKFTNASGANTYRFSRIFLNMINTGISDSSRVTIYAPVGNHMYEFPPETSYLMGRYVYLTDLPNNFASNQSFIIKIDFDYVSFTTTKNLTAEYLPDSVISLLSNAELDLRLINRSISSFSDDLSVLRDVYASDDLIEAKQAQQAVEDSVLDDFTGSGSESLKLNDVSGVKQVSGHAKQFLGTGGSSGNALGLFNVNGSGLWQWFSQTTANNLDTSSQTRSSDSYYFYDYNMQDYYDNLGGSYVSESY